MVTLDFLALCFYFVLPMLYVWYLGAVSVWGYLPSAPVGVSEWLEGVRGLPWVRVVVGSYPLAAVVGLAVVVVAVQEWMEGSVLWAHW